MRLSLERNGPAPAALALCRWCARRPVGHGHAGFALGLCEVCRRAQLRIQEEAGRFAGNHVQHPPLDPRGPTLARPGSEEKVEVMEDRARRGCAIHHPDDEGQEFLRSVERSLCAREPRPAIRVRWPRREDREDGG